MAQRTRKKPPPDTVMAEDMESAVKAAVEEAVKPLSPQQQAEKDVLLALREAGGGLINRNDIVTREGRRYVIPAKATLREGSKFLAKMADEQDEESEFYRTFNARPWDGAFCAYKAMKEVFGAVNHAAGWAAGFFGPVKVKPKMITINIAHNQTTQVPWGYFQLPGFDGCQIAFHSTHDDQKGFLFQINVEGPKKFAPEIEGLFNVIEEACSKYSIYRGSAIDGGEEAEFLNIDIDPEKVVYTDEVQVQMQANVWSVIEDSDLQREVGLPLKRSVLLHGPYGAGKSLFLALTARKAVESGWTFIRCRPGKDNYMDVLQTAALYAPAVVAFEDVDNLASSDASSVDVAVLLDQFDGVTAKNKEIIALLTTNYPENIHKGMMRPGRLDAVIKIADLDAKSVERLVKTLIPAGMLAEDVDYEAVTDAMMGYIPAYIKEATDRAIRYAISRGKDSDTVIIETSDLVDSASGLRPQLEMMQNASDHKGWQPPLEQNLRRVVGEAIQGMIHEQVLRQDVDAMEAEAATKS